MANAEHGGDRKQQDECSWFRHAGPLPGEDESSPHGKAEMRKRMLKLTAEQEQKDLLKTPLGPATLESNRN